MKKKITSIVAMVIFSATLLSTASALEVKNYETVNNRESATLINSVDEITKMGFSVVTVDDLIPAQCAYSDTVAAHNDVKSVLEGNVLFTANALEKHSQLSPEISASIYAGNIVAIYDPCGIYQEFEAMLNLPLRSMPVSPSEMAIGENEVYSGNLVIGKIYGVDETGHIRVENVNVPLQMSENEIFDAFYQQLNYFTEELTINEAQLETQVTRASNSYTGIGQWKDSFYGANNGGFLQVIYDVSTLQNYGGNDYYAIHGYITETPGCVLYKNEWTFRSLTTSLRSTDTSATLYKHGPDTTEGATTYTVNLGANKDGPNGGGSWQGTIKDITIKKYLLSDRECKWTATCNFSLGSSDVATASWTFEPGGTFCVPHTSRYVGIAGYTQLDVWRLLQPVTTIGASGHTAFIVYADGVIYADDLP